MQQDLRLVALDPLAQAVEADVRRIVGVVVDAVGRTVAEQHVGPLAASVATLRIVDEVRRLLGITFVEETAPGVPAKAE